MEVVGNYVSFRIVFPNRLELLRTASGKAAAIILSVSPITRTVAQQTESEAGLLYKKCYGRGRCKSREGGFFSISSSKPLFVLYDGRPPSVFFALEGGLRSPQHVALLKTGLRRKILISWTKSPTPVWQGSRLTGSHSLSLMKRSDLFAFLSTIFFSVSSFSLFVCFSHNLQTFCC